MDTVTSFLQNCERDFAESGDVESPWDIVKWAVEQHLDDSDGEVVVDTCFAGTWSTIAYSSQGQAVQFPGHKLECLPFAAFLLHKHVHGTASVRAHDGEVLGDGDLLRNGLAEVWSTRSGWSSLSFYPQPGQFDIFDEPPPQSDLTAIARALRTMLGFSGLCTDVPEGSRWFESISQLAVHVYTASQMFYCDLSNTLADEGNHDFTTWDTDDAVVAGLVIWCSSVCPNEDCENFRDPDQVESAARKFNKAEMLPILQSILARDTASTAMFLLSLAKETGSDFTAVLSLMRLLVKEYLDGSDGFTPYRFEYLYTASFVLDDDILKSIVQNNFPDADLDEWVYDPVNDIAEAGRDYGRHLAFSIEGMSELKEDIVVKGSKVRKFKGGLRAVDELGTNFTNGFRCRHEDLGDITMFVTSDGGLAACRTKWSRKVVKLIKSVANIQVMGNGVGFKDHETKEDSPWFGCPLLSAILIGACGREAPHWLLRAVYRGGLKINASSPVRSFIPKQALVEDGGLRCTSMLSGSVLSEYNFATDKKTLYWVAGDGLNIMKVQKTRNGTIELVEVEQTDRKLFLCEYTTKRKVG